MPDRYNNGSGSDRNLRNTDNEDTILIPNSRTEYYSQRTQQQLPPLKKTSRNSNRNNTYRPQPDPMSQNYQQQYSYGAQYNNVNARPNGGQNAYYQQNRSSGNARAPQQQNSQQSGGAYPPPQSNSQQRQYQQTSKPVKNTAPQKKRSAPKGKKKHKSLVGKIIRRIILVLLILFLLIFGIYSCTSLSIISKVNKEESGSRYHTIGAMEAKYVRSILIIGTDGRSADDRGRSDSMILLSLNSKTNEIIMTSFMRDCYVSVPGYGWDKLNAAYAYGGPDLLMDTIEQNFMVRIDDYVTINFNSFASIIDSVGGLDLEISDAEAEEINVILISEVNELMGDDRMADLLDGGGKVHLNGKQALSYARIRKVGNSDFERTERQRTVMSEMIDKLKSLKPSILKNIASNVIPDISANMTTMQMYLYSLRLPFVIRYDMKQLQIPAEGTYSAQNVELYGGTQSVLSVDFEANQEIIEDEVFGTEK